MSVRKDFGKLQKPFAQMGVLVRTTGPLALQPAGPAAVVLMMLRTSLSALLVLSLVACDGDGGEDGGAEGSGGSTGASTADPPGAGSSTTGAGSSASGLTVGSTSTSSATAETLGSETGTGGATTAETDATSADSSSGEASGSTTGESTLPIDCGDGDLPVRVDGGGSYATVSAGVAATPPDGTLYICPGEYTEDASMELDFPISVIGAGPNLVHIQTTADFVSSESDGAGFTVINSGISLEGFTLEGGRYGVSISLYQGADHAVTIRNVTLRGSDDAAVYLTRGVNDLDNISATFESMIVEDVQGAVDAAVAIREVPATFIDCIIRDNVAEHGGLFVSNAPVVFEGGQVVRNTATDPNGGGAFILASFPYPEFVISNSDWGVGEANENAPNDFDCGNSSDIGWLGAPANATCATDNADCCTPG